MRIVKELYELRKLRIQLIQYFKNAANNEQYDQSLYWSEQARNAIVAYRAVQAELVMWVSLWISFIALFVTIWK